MSIPAGGLSKGMKIDECGLKIEEGRFTKACSEMSGLFDLRI
jgi:hypothetical protein